MVSQPRRKVVHEDIWTWANLVTLLRTFACLIIFSIAATTHNETANYIGLAVYFLLDNLDGYLARTLNQETLLGAQLDILSDRILTAFFYLNFLEQYHELALPVVLFLAQFMVLDHMLSNQFLRWPIISPNYFYEVDRIIWFLNWSVYGKMCNTGLFTLLILLTRSSWFVFPVLAGLIGVKIYSLIRLHRLPDPAEFGSVYDQVISKPNIA